MSHLHFSQGKATYKYEKEIDVMLSEDGNNAEPILQNNGKLNYTLGTLQVINDFLQNMN